MEHGQERDAFCTHFEGASDCPNFGQGFAANAFSRAVTEERAGTPYIQVIERRPISRHWGLSNGEIKVASEVAHLFDTLGHSLAYAVVSDCLRPEREVRALVREFKNDLVQQQARAGLPRYWADMGEAETGYHANILLVAPKVRTQRFIERLQGRAAFAGSDVLHIQVWQGSAQRFVSYCSEERTPQAAFMPGLALKPRKPGSHPLGEGGGDRVRLSRELKRDLLEMGRIRPWKRTYASRALPRPEGVLVKVAEPDPRGLFGELPEQQRPARDWVRKSRPRLKLVVPEQLALPLDGAHDIISVLRGLGSTHHAIAARLGRSRSQVTNVLNRQFGASRQLVRRVLQLAA
jgi:hypothetical protein